jgi:hypothetical protein
MNIYVLTAVLFLSFFANTVCGADAPNYTEGDGWRIRYERSSIRSESNVLSSGTYDVGFSGGKFIWYADGNPVEPGCRGCAR